VSAEEEVRPERRNLPSYKEIVDQVNMREGPTVLLPRWSESLEEKGASARGQPDSDLACTGLEGDRGFGDCFWLPRALAGGT
jgi:hypothetical protein